MITKSLTSCSVIFLIAITIIASSALPLQALSSTENTYYVDCTNGNDSNLGTSENAAWKTIIKANAATLNPGEKILFKRGCTFSSGLIANRDGTETGYITYGAYGIGEKPLFRLNANGTTSPSAVLISGSYQLIENLRATIINPATDATCTDASGQPAKIGWYVGFGVNGHHNILQNNEAFDMTIGVNTTDASHHNKVLHNHIHDMNVFSRIYHAGAAMGAEGINLHGNDSEYAYNLFENNFAACNSSTDGKLHRYSAPFEVYNANRNFIHHNQAFGHVKHFEMGREVSDSNKTTDDNVLAYNLFVSDKEHARGPNIHGSTNAFGPVNRTKVYNNTIIFTGPNSEAIIASGPDTIVKNNIFVADGRVDNDVNTRKVAYICGPTLIQESNNIYWRYNTDGAGTGRVQIRLTEGGSCSYQNPNPTSKIYDPLFVAISTPVKQSDNFNLQSVSYGINNGTSELLVNTTLFSHGLFDINNPRVKVPQENTVDIGALEHGKAIVGDFFTDCRVNALDISILFSKMGTSDWMVDMNSDDTITTTDIAPLIRRYGTSCLN